MELLEERTLLDTAGPRILWHAPTEVRNDVFDHVDVAFNKAIDLRTFTVDDVAITGPTGEVAPTGISLVSGDTYRISFDPLTVRGSYEAIIGPDVADLAGDTKPDPTVPDRPGAPTGRSAYWPVV